MNTIVLTGGGTAGHCTPNFALLNGLSKHFDEIYYIGSKNGIEENLVKKQGLPYYPISCVKLVRGNFSKNLSLPFKFNKSLSEAKKILKQLKPKVVFSKGGYVGLPVAISASRLGIPVIVHESDLTLGLANKIASRFAVNTLTAFQDTALTVKNGIYVGSPLRSELFNVSKCQALEYFKFKSTKPVLLVTGGSLGAKAINEVVVKTLPALLDKFSVLHVVGKGNLNLYAHPDYRQIEFADMAYSYGACDFAVSRAGANTAFELLALKKPTLFIPLPKGNSRGDQVDNAKYFTSRGLSLTLSQSELNENSFLTAINNLIYNKDRLIANMNKFSHVNGAEKITAILNKY